MPISTADLYKRAMDLDEEERAALAGMLLESLDSGSEEGVEGAWLAEVERRMADLDAGREGIPWEEVRRRLLRAMDGSEEG